ncbi:hydroxyectoine utilization dehydratase EutB [Dongia soli]|uniref:Hydroxyectoine utilization dehydratase EutB n=1 Tax=Dongia soli TaxID=600628 RepID=A0ABU5EG84_9PROT|nr:hydroxyectoine utilization dehydratase EutB [Dongia soli]MDY0885252.1 hydroxyectoine utilization dehydratase EutB [Dongia soli]
MPDLAEIQRAAQAIAGTAERTPYVISSALSALAGQEIGLKLETRQPIGAFKIRGAANAISRLSPEQARRGVGCCSTGNHGRALAYAAAKNGIRAIVCLSSLVPQNKVRAIAELGAEVHRIGKCQDDAQAEIDRLVADEDITDIPPFDHPDIIAGQGTIGLELLEDRPDLDAIVVPLSGGGLISGIAIAAKAMKPEIKIIGVSMERGAAMQASLAAGHPVEVTELPTLADSLGGGIGLNNRWTFDICRRLVDEIILLSEAEIYRGMQHLARKEGLVVEGAAAVGPAALLASKLKPAGPMAMIISGQNIDQRQFDLIAAGKPVQVGDITVEG